MLSTWVVLALASNPHLDEARRLITAFQEEQALVELERAAARSASDPVELAQVYLYRGVAYAGLVDGARAIESFRAALALDPKVELPPVSERVTDWFAEALKLAGLPPRALAAAPVEPPAPVVQPPAPKPPEAVQPTPPRRRWRLYAGGALLGAAALAAGGAGWAGGDAQRLNARWKAEPGVGASAQLHQQAADRATTANVLFGVAGALVIGGGVLFVLEL